MHQTQWSPERPLKKERKKGVRAIRRIAGSKSLFNVTSIVEKILRTIT